MASVHITESLIPLAPKLKLSKAPPAAPPAPATSATQPPAEDDDFALSLACPKLPFTQQLLPSPPPSPFRATHRQSGDFPSLAGDAVVSLAGSSSFVAAAAPPRMALPPPPRGSSLLPASPPPSPPMRQSLARQSKDLSISLASNLRSNSRPEEEDEFEAELESELALLFPVPPTRQEGDSPHGSPSRVTSALPRIGGSARSVHRLSSGSSYSIASPSSARFHLPLAASTSPRLGADPSFGRPMSVDFASFGVQAEEAKKRASAESGGAPRLRDRRQADMDESRAQVRLSSLLSELGV